MRCLRVSHLFGIRASAASAATMPDSDPEDRKREADVSAELASVRKVLIAAEEGAR